MSGEDKKLDVVTPTPTCAKPGCGKPAASQCPTCIQMKLEDTFFCTQECFKEAWKEHSAIHKYWKKARAFLPPDQPYYGPLRPAYVSPMRTVPNHIPKPDYWATGIPISELQERPNAAPIIYTEKQIEGIRLACRLGREVLDAVHAAVRPGITTEELDRIAHEACIERGCYPSPLNYKNFPKSICTSVNEVICHGIPDARPLQDGDILNVDVSVFKDGYHGDLNETFVVGNVSAADKKLIYTTYLATMEAIDAARNGTMIREFGRVISDRCEAEGYGVVRSYCGHGIGELFHCAPNVPHYRRNRAPGVCKPGMVFTIEPMINAGHHDDCLWEDDWTATTVDGSRSAQFEHTLLIREDGSPEILTARTEQSPPLWWQVPGVDVEAVLAEAGGMKYDELKQKHQEAAPADSGGQGEGSSGKKRRKKKNKNKKK